MREEKTGYKTIYILGAQSSFLIETIEICELTGFKNIICLDNLESSSTINAGGYPVIQLSQLKSTAFPAEFVCCVHTPLYREKMVSQVPAFLKPCSLFHPTSVLSKRASISNNGVLIGAQAVVGANTGISDFVLINRGALVGHDIKLGRFVTIESGVSLNGFCQIQDKSYIGAGAIVLPKIKIGKNCVVAAGAVVREDVSDHCMVAGVPAEVKKENIKGYLGSM